MKTLHDLLSDFSSIISDPTLLPFAQIYPGGFTRSRKITLNLLLLYLIFRNNNVLSEDIVNFFGAVRNFEDLPTRQAVIKRMSVLNFNVWDEIMRRYRENIYSNVTLYKLKDYIVVAVDGSFVDLPPHYVLNRYFGGDMKKDMTFEDIKKPQAKVSMIYDVLNQSILDFSVAPYKTSEIPLLFDHLRELDSFFENKKIILLADRYYGSAELFKYCEMHNIKYIVRAKKNFFKKYIAEHGEDENDFRISIEMDKAWIRRIKNDDIRDYIKTEPVLDIRVVRGEYTYFEKKNGKENEVTISSQYFTNLNESEFDTAEIIDMYHFERWKVETGYDVLKNQLDIEQLNVHNPIGIINEIMGKVVFHNIEKLIFMESKKVIAEKEEADKAENNNMNTVINESIENAKVVVNDDTSDANKYEYIPNNKYVIEIVHHINFVLNFQNGIDEVMLENMVASGSRVKVPVRKGRHYKRWKKFLRSIPNTRHRIDGRRNPPVAKGKTGFITTKS